MFYEDFSKPILVKFGVSKWKPLSSFSFRQLHRSLIEFHDYELQQICCDLAGVQSVKDELSFGYCCVDEKYGLQIHMLGACNRDGRSDWWVPIPDGKETVFSYHDIKEKLITISDSYPKVIAQCLPRCKQLMELHEQNPTIMLRGLDGFRLIEQPLDIKITVPTGNGAMENVVFRPVEVVSEKLLHGYLLDEPRFNGELHKGDALVVKLIRNEQRRIIAVTQYLSSDWVLADGGRCIGEQGSEDGIIIEDEEYDGICRITLEDCTYRFAITCGIYGAMVHTAFCGKNNAFAIYDEMKKDLQLICDTCDPDSIEDADRLCELISSFVNKY